MRVVPDERDVLARERGVDMTPFRFQLLHRAAQKNTTVLHALERGRLGVALRDCRRRRSSSVGPTFRNRSAATCR